MASKASSQECGNPECNATSTPQVLLECARCDTVSYCSKECQIAAWPVHKPTCRRQNYIIKFHVAPDIITNPPVVRTLSCPADALFSHLDMALQVAFGWASTHSFHFAVSNPDFVLPSPEECDRIAHQMLRLRMMGLENDASMPREFLFRVVDPSMDVALLADRANQPYRSHPNTPEVGADDYKLYQLFDDPKYKGEHYQLPGYRSSIPRTPFPQLLKYMSDIRLAGRRWQHELRLRHG
ncbi:hypothetical protein F4677DRAFT_421886 [Hypoxylon crocopeplum]|nr:hypothetical protein F4677DRAFT_421886 [Hypoxylon crocopeplum]